MNLCVVCRSSSFSENSVGELVCNDCGSVSIRLSQTNVEVELEVGNVGRVGPRGQRQKASQIISLERLEASTSEERRMEIPVLTASACLESFQWILRQQGKALVQKHGCSKKVMRTMRELWFTYLRYLLQPAFDARKRKGDESANEKKAMAPKTLSFFDSLRGKAGGKSFMTENGAVIAPVKPSEQTNIPKSWSGAPGIRQIERHILSWFAPRSTREGKDKTDPVSIKKEKVHRMATKRRREMKDKKPSSSPHEKTLQLYNGRLCLATSLAFCLVACRLNGEPILATHLCRWARAGLIPYLFENCFRAMPVNLRKKMGIARNFFTFGGEIKIGQNEGGVASCLPSAMEVHEMSLWLALRLDINLPDQNLPLACVNLATPLFQLDDGSPEFPEWNAAELLKRIVIALHFSKDIVDDGVGKRSMKNATSTTTTTSTPSKNKGKGKRRKSEEERSEKGSLNERFSKELAQIRMLAAVLVIAIKSGGDNWAKWWRFSLPKMGMIDGVPLMPCASRLTFVENMKRHKRLLLHSNSPSAGAYLANLKGSTRPFSRCIGPGGVGFTTTQLQEYARTYCASGCFRPAGDVQNNICHEKATKKEVEKTKIYYRRIETSGGTRGNPKSRWRRTIGGSEASPFIWQTQLQPYRDVLEEAFSSSSSKKANSSSFTSSNVRKKRKRTLEKEKETGESEMESKGREKKGKIGRLGENNEVTYEEAFTNASLLEWCARLVMTDFALLDRQVQVLEELLK